MQNSALLSLFFPSPFPLHDISVSLRLPLIFGPHQSTHGLKRRRFSQETTGEPCLEGKAALGGRIVEKDNLREKSSGKQGPKTKKQLGKLGP